MAAIVIYSPGDPVVNNRVLSYLVSAHTPDYADRTDTLVNPDLSGVAGVEARYWQVDGTAVAAMGASDRTAVDDFLLAKTVRQKKYNLNVMSTSFVKTDEYWYDTDNGDGTYTGMVEHATYTYASDNITLLYRTTVGYYYDGSVASTVRTTFYKSGNNIIEKNEEL